MAIAFSDLPDLQPSNKRRQLPLSIRAFQKVWYDSATCTWWQRTFFYPDKWTPRDTRMDRKTAIYLLRQLRFALVANADSDKVLPLRYNMGPLEFEAHVLETLLREQMKCSNSQPSQLGESYV